MNCWQELEQRLNTLNAKIEDLKPRSIVGHDYVLDWTQSGDRFYYRTRDKAGGKVQKYISPELWSELREQIANGRQMQRLERERDRLVKRMDAIAALASGMANNKQG